MKTKIKTYFLLFMILSLTVLFLAGCGQAASNAEPGQLDVTQAYQTIEARLTEAVAQTPIPPTVTSTPEILAASATPTLEPTQTSAAPTATKLPAVTQTPATSCDQADAAYPSIDITIPDDTQIPAGNSFTKVWRIVNTGTCNWTAEYSAVFVSGDQMSAPASVAISKPVGPGQSVDIDVTLVAPQEAGTYRGYWKLQNANGQQFGIGPGGKNSFWVQIVVTVADTPTPTATLAPTPQTLVSGSVTLNANDSLDLDTLQIGGGADLIYLQVSDGITITGHQLSPLGGATAGVFGTAQPTYAQCKNAAKSAGPVDANANSGAYLCYLTDQGLTGWARIDALDTTNGTLSVTILTWAAP